MTDARKQRKRESWAMQQHIKKHPECCVCGYHQEGARFSNHTHHVKPIAQGGTCKDGLLTLCRDCHTMIHTINGKLNWHAVDEDFTALLIDALKDVTQLHNDSP